MLNCTAKWPGEETVAQIDTSIWEPSKFSTDAGEISINFFENDAKIDDSFEKTFRTEMSIPYKPMFLEIAWDNDAPDSDVTYI